MISREDLHEGDLVAVPSSIGPRWQHLIEDAWKARAALLPVDERLGVPEREALLERARPTVVLDETAAFTRRESPPLLSSETMFVFHTSGTSGTPKLVELSRYAIRAAVEASTKALGATDRDTWVSCLTPAHVGGMLVLLRGVFLGTTVRVVERSSPELVEQARGHFVSLVPTMLARLLDAGLDLSTYRAILVGGGGLRPELRARAEAARAPLVETYGLTESCGGVVYDGTPFTGTEVRIHGGLVELRGPTLMTGYLRDRASTANAVTTDGWLRTRDAGEIDDGRLRVFGRVDDVVNTGGEKVWPHEVEAALATHAAVADVAVVGRTDPEWGQRIVAFVVPRDPTTPPSLDELRDHVGARIARFKAPRELVLLDALPRTASGKVRRAALSAERE